MPETGSPIFIGFSCGDKGLLENLSKWKYFYSVVQKNNKTHFTQIFTEMTLDNIEKSCFSSPWGLYIFIFVEFLVIVPRVYVLFIHPFIPLRTQCHN